jgi:hypothetical protein
MPRRGASITLRFSKDAPMTAALIALIMGTGLIAVMPKPQPVRVADKRK